MNLYGRGITVRVINDVTGAELADIATFSNHDIDFSVSKDGTSQQNDLSLQIYNLSDRARTMFQRENAGIELSAGYGGRFSSLFRGRVRHAATTQAGADWVTKVEAGEGAGVFFLAVNYSFGPGTSVKKVCEKILSVLDQIGIKAGNFSTTVALETGSFPKGTSYSGSAFRQLQFLARDNGGWLVSVQLGQLLFYKPSVPVDRKTVTLSPSTGLIGLPEAGEKKNDQTKKVYVKARALLQPHLSVGSLVLLESTTIKGEHVVHELKHSGSNYGDTFFTDLELLSR